MGTSRYTSNLLGINTPTLKSFKIEDCETDIPIVKAGTLVQLGEHQYIAFGSVAGGANIASVLKAMDASIKTSLYLSTNATAPGLYLVTDATTATLMT